MNKPTIVRTWVAGLIALFVGLVVAGTGTGIMLGLGGHFVWRGQDVVGFTPAFNDAFWWGVAVVSVGGLLLLGGVVTQFVAWIGALLNTWKLEDKLWFVLLLVLGLFRAEIVIMLIYVVFGPDGTKAAPRPSPSAPMAAAPA
jgi:hypothetical protein